MSVEPLVPYVDEDTAPFWEATRKGELRIQQCDGCKRLRFPPRPICPWCHSKASSWPALSGRGRIYSYVVPHPPLLPQFTDLAPYNVVLVELDEDRTIRLCGNLLEREGGEINEVDPATIEIGSPVRVVFQRMTEEITLPRWVRA